MVKCVIVAALILLIYHRNKLRERTGLHWDWSRGVRSAHRCLIICRSVGVFQSATPIKVIHNLKGECFKSAEGCDFLCAPENAMQVLYTITKKGQLSLFPLSSRGTSVHSREKVLPEWSSFARQSTKDIEFTAGSCCRCLGFGIDETLQS